MLVLSSSFSTSTVLVLHSTRRLTQFMNHTQNQSPLRDMITIFIVLGVILLAIPAICITVMLLSKLKRDKRAVAVKNATVTTTMRVGGNGRTVFETKAAKQTPPRNPSARRDQVLPYTNQQATAMARPQSASQKAWQRLSRPFSTAAPVAHQEEDQIELRQKPAPYRSKFTEHTSPVSPIARPSPVGSSSSWNTINRFDGPVSPLSVTNMPASSSVTGTIIRGYERSSQHSEMSTGIPFHNVPLTPQAVRHDERSADNARAGPVVGAGGSFGRSVIRQNVLDKANMKMNRIELQQAPGGRKGKGGN